MALDQAYQDTAVVRAFENLGGTAVFHRAIRDRMEAHDLLMSGVPSQALVYLWSSLDRSVEADSLEKLLGVSLRTIQRFRKSERLLDMDQGNQAWTVAEVLGRAESILGTRAAAEGWLEKPAMALNRRRPVDLLATRAGTKLVEDYLTQLDYGVYV
ncbi:antitoxin Xre/MbcA/ParS toxin-binding domain-containing protein [Tropicimonas sp.]|uniref:type II RES/Xre toxin-antitoxin system antitoxin n=1 Tax=Tropicimonas sp. TaxID=2067044 RepID=UPI003A8518B2